MAPIYTPSGTGATVAAVRSSSLGVLIVFPLPVHTLIVRSVASIGLPHGPPALASAIRIDDRTFPVRSLWHACRCPPFASANQSLPNTHHWHATTAPSNLSPCHAMPCHNHPVAFSTQPSLPVTTVIPPCARIKGSTGPHCMFPTPSASSPSRANIAHVRDKSTTLLSAVPFAGWGCDVHGVVHDSWGISAHGATNR